MSKKTEHKVFTPAKMAGNICGGYRIQIKLWGAGTISTAGVDRR